MRWRRQHKWFGIVCLFLMASFCLSGIVLNHRSLFSDVEVNRKWLPSRYEYKQWNGGLMRGTIRYGDSVAIYGNNGIWLADTLGNTVGDFNLGLPEAADHRQVRNVIVSRGRLYAASSEQIYRYDGGNVGWKACALQEADGERLTDIACKGDTIVAVGRSHLYVSTAQGKPFVKITLAAPDDYDGKVSLFRTVWLLHSGELFGTVGKLIVDAVAIALIFLCLTGLMCWLLPIYNKRCKRKATRPLHFSFVWHNKAGRWTIVLTMLIALTGWCLRPPVMIPLVLNKAKAIPLTTMDSPNPWNDRLRMLRYDDKQGDWLLSTSEGFYSLADFESASKKTAHTPPVSVMGLNVLQKDTRGNWLCGSFSGMFVWNRQTGKSMDFFTRKPVPEKAGAPFGNKAVSGYSNDFSVKPFAVEYYDGTDAVPQPEELRQLPMSLWNVALEIHSGRIYIGSLATFLFIFIAGLVCIWCLWSGWKMKRKQKAGTKTISH